MGLFRLLSILAGVLLLQGPALAAGEHAEAPGPCQDREAPASLDCALAPTATFGPSGRVWVAWAFGGHVYVNHSDDRGETFSPPVPVNRIPERVAADGENRPKIRVGPKGTVLVSWVKRLPQPYTGHVRFARSVDGGQTFSKPLIVNDNRAITSHRFESFAVTDDGEVVIAWLDKRDRVAVERQGGTYNGAALYYAVSRDRGKSFGPNRKIADHTCECCRTAMALDARGLPVVVWRHIYGDNIRDHALVRFEGLASPGDSVRLSHDRWRIDACPHHGPDVDAGEGTIHAVWFNNAAERHGLFYAHSAPGGRKFSSPVSVGSYEAGASHPAVLAMEERVWLAWKELAGERTRLLVKHSRDGGQTWSAPREMAATTGSSGHPQLLRDGAEAFVSWQTQEEGFHLIPAGIKE